MVLIVAVPVPGKDISSIYCHTDCDVTKEVEQSITWCLYNVPHFHAVMCLCHLSSWIPSTQIPGNCPAGVDIKARRLDILYQCWGEQFAIWVNIDKSPSPSPPLHIVWCGGYQVELSTALGKFSQYTEKVLSLLKVSPVLVESVNYHFYLLRYYSKWAFVRKHPNFTSSCHHASCLA